MKLELIYAVNLQEGDHLAGQYVPDAPTTPVQTNAAALPVTEVQRDTEERTVCPMFGQLAGHVYPNTARLLVIR